MVAAKAIKQAGVPLKGDLVLAAVVGEVAFEPVDEFLSPDHLGKEVGTRYTIDRGVIADYALVCEATGFSVTWVEAGKAFFKVRIHGGPSLYTPYLARYGDMAMHPNAAVRAATFIQALAEWADRYEDAYRYECPGGTVLPKVNIGAIRGGVPTRLTRTLELCDLYLDVRITPDADPLIVRAELEQLLRRCGLEGAVELTTYRKAYEGKGVEPLVDAIRRAHREVVGADPPPPPPPVSSMWRDLNVYNEVGIPSVTYGPATGSTGGGNNTMAVDDLVNACRSYALIALDICNRDKPAGLRT
jgi:acetylornithine deacetylase/succinyl-diaminopimelate desuccinylase-like protein